MNMKKRGILTVLLAAAMTLCLAPSALAQDEWKFGIGTGFTSFSLDGDIGFAVPGGPPGVIFEVDLDNSDTSDLFESGFGFGGFASKGKWSILYVLGTLTLEDEEGGNEFEWDRTKFEVAGVYNFAETGNHRWGALFGVRYMSHDWEITTPANSVDFDENWTDGLVGLTHAWPFSEKWSWTNRLDGGFGDSEGSFLLKSSINWQATPHWAFNFNVQQHSIEFGDEDDIADSDFYFYDVDEPGVGLGFLYTW